MKEYGDREIKYMFYLFTFLLLAVRLMLGLFAVTAFGQFRREVARKFGEVAGIFLTVITISQFHLVFYMSRPLPNVFALILGISPSFIPSLI
jgi:hypothetical protein